MNKIKVNVLDGPKEVADFLGDSIELTNELTADIIILAGDTEVSPEYYGQKTKNEKYHDPVKDHAIYSQIISIRKTNPSAVVIGLRKGASFVDAIYGASISQNKRFDDNTSVECTAVFGMVSRGSIITPRSRFKIPSFSHYVTRVNRYTSILRYKYGSILARYEVTTTLPKAISIHHDPLLLDKDDHANQIFRCFILNNLYTHPNVRDTNLARLSDISIWASRSKANSFCIELDARPCFGRLVKGPLAQYGAYDHRVLIDYDIKVMKEKGHDANSHERCVTFLTHEDYKEYYERLKKIYPFEYSVDESNEEYVMLHVTIDGCCFWHKFILTQLRYIYQYPMNYILHDSLKLKKLKEFKDVDIMDILNIVAKTACNSLLESNEYMLLAYSPDDNCILKPFNEEEFRRKADEFCKSNEHASLNSFANTLVVSDDNKFKYLYDIEPCFGSWNMCVSTFESRIPFYLYNLNIYNKLRHD